MPGTVVTRLDGAVGICRIESPETRNALSPELLAGIVTGLEELDADPAARCLLLIGGDEVFATGADLRSLGAAELAPGPEAAELWDRLAAIESPIVAAVSGWALGSGFELALVCDLIVASKTAQFGEPEITLGLIPGGGATQRLTRIVGKQRAMEIVLSGRHIDAGQAREYGFVNVVAEKKHFRQIANDLAAEIATRAPIAARLAKRAILAAEREGLDQGLETERRLFAEAMATEDRVEGVTAFLEGRRPRFEGK